MKKPVFTAFFVLLAALFISCSSSVDSGNSAGQVNSIDYTAVNWVNSGVIYGSSTGKKDLSLLYFTDDSCSDGLLMDFYTFTDSAVIVELNSSYNAARISTTSDTLIQFYDSTMTGNELFKLYNLVGVPSFLILDGNNDYFGRIQANYYPVDSFITLLNFYVEKNQQ